jgi:hypothetical protein
VVANALTQAAGTGTTSFANLTSAGTVTLTTAAVAGTYNVGGFTVTSGQTIASGTISGVAGSGAATLATDPGSTGTQTFNGCTIQVGCAPPSPPPPSPPPSPPSSGGGLTLSQASNAGSATNQVSSALNQPAPSSDSDQSNVHGFEVQIPTENIDWTDPAGDLRIRLAPEFQPLSRYFYAGETSNRFQYGGRSNR